MKNILLFIAICLVSCSATKQNIDLNQYKIKEKLDISFVDGKTVDEVFNIVEQVINRHYPKDKIKIKLNLNLETNSHNQTEGKQVTSDSMDDFSQVDDTGVDVAEGTIGGMNLKGMTLKDIILYLCSATACDYSVEKNTITISERPPNVDLSKYIIERPSEVVDRNITLKEALVRLEKAMDKDYPGHNIEFIFDNELHKKRKELATKPYFTDEELGTFTYEGSEELGDEFEDEFDDNFEEENSIEGTGEVVCGHTAFTFKNMPLDDTLLYLCQTIGCSYTVKGNKVIIY